MRLERLAAGALSQAPGPTPDPADRPPEALAGRGLGVSAVPQHDRQRVDMVAGFLCAFSFALSGIAIARSPGVLAPAAILVALVAVRMTESHRTLAGVAVVVSAVAFFVGMLVAITTDSPLY